MLGTCKHMKVSMMRLRWVAEMIVIGRWEQTGQKL